MSIDPGEIARIKDAAYLEAAAFELPVGWEEGRQQVYGLTIDSESTRDRDDALAKGTLPNGGTRLSTGIADVGTFLWDKRDIEAHARHMGETRYLAAGNVTMIPPRVSEGVLSILDDKPDKNHPGKMLNTPVISVHLGLSPEGEIGGLELSRDSMTPQAMSYRRVGLLTAGKGPLKEVAGMRKYEDVALALLNKRREGGAFAFYDRERGVMTDDDGGLITFPERSNRSGQLIVQEFMILANTAVATYMARHNIPALYRNHHLREGAKERDLQRLLSGEELTGNLLGSVYARARYSPHLEGHVGLSLDAYMHFTSPLRRFADFVNHCNLVAHLDERKYPYQGDALEEIAAHLNGVQDITRAGRRETAIRSARAGAAAGALAATAQTLKADGDNSTRVKASQSNPALSTVLRHAVATGEAVDGLAEVLSGKLEAAGLTVGEMAYIVPTPHVQGGGMEAVRTSLMDRLAARPAEAFSVLTAAEAAGTITEFTHAETNIAEQVFRSTASIRSRDGTLHTATADATGKNAASQLAALKLLAEMNNYALPEAAIDTTPPANRKNELQELLVAGKLRLPDYATKGFAGNFVCTLTFNVGGQPYTFEGRGTNKKEAEQAAAQLGLEAAKVVVTPIPKPKAIKYVPPSSKRKPIPVNPGLGPINKLQEYVAKQNGLKIGQPDDGSMPCYEISQAGGEPHAPNFTATVTARVNGVDVQYTGEGPSKAKAKEAAAAAALAAITSQDNEG